MKIVIKKMVIHNHPVQAEPKNIELRIDSLIKEQKVNPNTAVDEWFLNIIRGVSPNIGESEKSKEERKEAPSAKWPTRHPMISFPYYLLRMQAEERSSKLHSREMIKCFFHLNKGRTKTRGYLKKSYHQLKEIGLQCGFNQFMDMISNLSDQESKHFQAK